MSARKMPCWGRFCPAAVLYTGFIGWVWLGTSYRISSDELIVGCGPIKHRFPLKGTVRVRSCRNPVAGPALSMQRLQISAEGVLPLLVSPADREGFVSELKKAGGDVRVQGDVH